MLEISEKKIDKVILLLKQKILSDKKAKVAFDMESDPEKALMAGLQVCYSESEFHKKLVEEHECRINEILSVIVSLANLDYSKKAAITGSGDIHDALAAGINMLGEELKVSTVSLREKEVLLKEVHHRVKNNLQIVSSLLNLQAGTIKDSDAKEKFRDSQERVKSMALIHEQLYEKKDFSKIDFGVYIKDIVNSIFSTYKVNRGKVSLKLDIALKNPHFELDTAIPCGLILNEILSNCFKYAFPGKKTGEISISLSDRLIKGKSHYTFEISDNGVGFPKDFNVQETETLGLQLVHTLVEQLGGKIKIKSKSKKTSFLINFQG